eukprot:TRINITY_DN3719_c0_g1_i1.p1 TRINITY_DN3719_c0_g1~~TRINITY_DN3719_c0_g1_i1.p1  ORF type:complete len:666 (+),score=149.68 TRINITY_DN3719_c0_g1_i1:104-2101(+)
MALAGPTWQSQSIRHCFSTTTPTHSNGPLIRRLSCTCRTKSSARSATVEKVGHGVPSDAETPDRGVEFSGGMGKRQGKAKGKGKLKAQSLATNGAARAELIEGEALVEEAVPVTAVGTVEAPEAAAEAEKLGGETVGEVSSCSKGKKTKGKNKTKPEHEGTNGVARLDVPNGEDAANEVDDKVETPEASTDGGRFDGETFNVNGKSKKSKAKKKSKSENGAASLESIDVDDLADEAESNDEESSEKSVKKLETVGEEAGVSSGKPKKGDKVKAKSKAKSQAEETNGAAKMEAMDIDNSMDSAAADEAVEEEKPKHMVPLRQVVLESIGSLQGACEGQLQRLGVDPDESVIHDLRVALRRLRSALNLFVPFVDLPKDTLPEISKILRILGSIRDADVMLETLATVRESAGELLKDEAKSFEALQKEMIDERGCAMATASKWLRSKRTSRLLEELHSWVADPKVSAKTACLLDSSTCLVVPSLLTPHAAELLLDSAWHISNLTATKQQSSSSHSADDVLEETAVKVNLKGLVTDHEDFYRMHDLRKLMREMRYRMELLQPVYAGRARYSASLANLQKLQGVLGDLQDLHVLSAYLRRHFRGESSNIARAIVGLHEEIWEKWLETRGILGSPAGHQQLYRAISLTKGPKNLQPVAVSAEEEDSEGAEN